MAQQTAMQKLFTNIENMDIKFAGVQEIFLEMEKEQIIAARLSNLRILGRTDILEAEQYYNETYK